MAQLQVKNYLERNKIGSLFEELMARLIRDQPEDPLSYIRNTIQRKLEQRDGPQASAPLSQTLPTGRVQRSGSTSSDSEKKRTSSLSKTQPLQSAGAPRQSTGSLSGKSASATSSTTNLDELFAATRSMKRDSKGDASVSKSTPGPSGRPAAVQLDISEEALAKWAPQQAGPINIGYCGPARREKNADEGELKVAKQAKKKKQKEVTAENLNELKGKQKASEGKSSKAELAKMIAEMEAQERAAQVQLRALQAQAVKPHRDDADEVSEDEETLAKEGVTKKKDDGDAKKDKKKKKDKKGKKENGQVRFAVCRMCARMLEPQDEAASQQPTSRVMWTGAPLASARNPLQDAAVNLPAAAAVPSAQPQNAVAPATPNDTRSQLEILQDLRLSLGLSSEDIATGRVSPYWKSLHSDVSDVEDGSGASARNSARPPSRPAGSRPGTASAARRAPRSGQEFFNQ